MTPVVEKMEGFSQGGRRGGARTWAPAIFGTTKTSAFSINAPSSAYRADRPTIRQAEASVFPSFFSQLKKLIIFLFEFSLPGT